MKRLKSALIQAYGSHHVSLINLCAAGTNKQIKDLLRGDNHAGLSPLALAGAVMQLKRHMPTAQGIQTNVFGRDPGRQKGDTYHPLCSSLLSMGHRGRYTILVKRHCTSHAQTETTT